MRPNFNFDFISERAVLNRKIVFWRIFAIAILAFLIGYLLSNSLRERNDILNRPFISKSDYVAKIEIKGEIDDGSYLMDEFERLAKDETMKAVVVEINSPGGAPVQSEQIYQALRKISSHKKPVVATVGGVSASGSYMIALAADYILAYGMSIVGSIGVIMSTFEVTELAQKVGITPFVVKSSPLKAMPNYMEKNNDEVRSASQEIVNSLQENFINLVRSRRLLNMPQEEVLRICDGRAYSGHQALKMKLIDEIGGYSEARKWLATKHGIKEDVVLRKVSVNKKDRKAGFPYGYFKKSIDGLLDYFFKILLTSQKWFSVM